MSIHGFDEGKNKINFDKGVPYESGESYELSKDATLYNNVLGVVGNINNQYNSLTFAVTLPKTVENISSVSIDDMYINLFSICKCETFDSITLTEETDFYQMGATVVEPNLVMIRLIFNIEDFGDITGKAVNVSIGKLKLTFY